MSKYLIALAIAGATSAAATAQTPPAPVNQAQPAKPQMVKKTVCEDSDNPYSRIGRVCHTVMVPAKPTTPATGQQAQLAPQDDPGR